MCESPGNWGVSVAGASFGAEGGVGMVCVVAVGVSATGVGSAGGVPVSSGVTLIFFLALRQQIVKWCRSQPQVVMWE